MHRDFHFIQKVKTAKNDIIRKIVQRDTFLLQNQSRKKQNMPILTLILKYNEFKIKEYDNKNNVCTKSILEMTEQLLFPVSWSTQYNPKSVILFSNKTCNFHFSVLLILLIYSKNKLITLKLQLIKFSRSLPQLC